MSYINSSYMTPDLLYGENVKHASGDVAYWQSPPVGEKPPLENFVVWDSDSPAAQELRPLSGRKVSETGLTAIVGTRDGEVSHTLGKKLTLNPNAVLNIDIRTKRK